MTDAVPKRRGLDLPVLFILATVMIEAMGIGLILPVMPALLEQVQGTDLSGAALWGGLLSAIYAVMQFLFSPLIGNVSDRFGRRPVLLISMGVIAVDYVVMALAGSIWILLIGRIVAGIAAATMSTAQAFMADISPPEKKAQNFGLVSAGFGLGFVLGPAIGGMLAEFGPRAPFWAAAMLAGANFVLGLIVLPETLRRQWIAKTGTDIHEALGQSECSTFLSGGPGRPAPAGRSIMGGDRRAWRVISGRGAAASPIVFGGRVAGAACGACAPRAAWGGGPEEDGEGERGGGTEG